MYRVRYLPAAFRVINNAPIRLEWVGKYHYFWAAVLRIRFGIRCIMTPWIRDLGWTKIRIRDKQHGSYFQFSGEKHLYLNSLLQTQIRGLNDPISGSKNSDPGLPSRIRNTATLTTKNAEPSPCWPQWARTPRSRRKDPLTLAQSLSCTDAFLQQPIEQKSINVENSASEFSKIHQTGRTEHVPVRYIIEMNSMA